MRAVKLAPAVGVSALLLCAFAPTSGAQERARERAPSVRVYSTNGAYALATTSYVTPVIEVSENAYVFAVSMDLDGQIRVLHPDFPGLAVQILAHRQLDLPNFFAGFAGPSDASGYYSSAGYSGYDSYNDGYLDSRGTVIALASRAPFNLELIESDGDWDIATIRQLMQGRGPESAAQSLARYLGANGEPIGRDFMRFAGRRNYNSAYGYAGYSACDLFGYQYAPTLAARFFQANVTIAFLRQRGRRATIGYDICGFPFVIFQPSSGGGQFPKRLPQPGQPGDTSSLIPRSRLPRHGTDRPKLPQSASQPVPKGVFPLPQRGELPQIGDVTITAPRGRHREPGQIPDGYRSQPGTMSVPQGRLPIERITVPRNEPEAATGATAGREYRPEPRSAAPPPSRAPDTPRQSSPAPVERERPTPPPPPPRETPAVTNRPAPPKGQ